MKCNGSGKKVSLCNADMKAGKVKCPAKVCQHEFTIVLGESGNTKGRVLTVPKHDLKEEMEPEPTKKEEPVRKSNIYDSKSIRITGVGVPKEITITVGFSR